MVENLEKEGIKHLEKIEQELEEIKETAAGSRWRSLRNGLYQGAGAVVGSIVAVILLGWLLSFLGIIPGLGELGQYLQDVIAKSRLR